MQFPVFSSSGPQVSVSLFGDAAKAGAALGQAIPSITSSIIQGGLKGYEQGLDIAAKQHEIDQFPVQDRLREAQAKNAEAQAQINTAEAALATLDESTQYQIKQEQLTQQLLQAEKANTEFPIKQELIARLSSTDPKIKASVLDDPKFTSILLSDPKFADQVTGGLNKNPYANKEALNQLAGSIGYYKQQEFKQKQDAIEAKTKDAADKAIDKLYLGVISEGKLAGVTVGMNQQDLYNSIEAFPEGTKQVDPKTKKIIPGTADKPVTLGLGFEVFKNGVKQEGVVLNDSQASKLNLFKNTYSKAYGVAPPKASYLETPIAPPTPPPVDVKTFQDLVEESAATGLPQDVVDKTLAYGKEAGATANFLQRAYSDLMPSSLASNYVDKSLAPYGANMIPGANVRRAVEQVASEQTDKVLNAFQTGSSAEKEALRDWAKSNEVSLSPSSLRRYFERGLTAKLSDNYDAAYDLGRQEQLRAKGSNAVTEQADATRLESLKNKTPEDALRTVEKATQISKDLGLSQKQTDKEVEKVSDISFNPLLSNKPSYIKAIAAVESAGQVNAVSETGVKGLMQVTQKTAGMYGLNRNIPEQNVLAGSLYIEDLIREFKGAKDLAFAAYNAGPGVVKYAQILAGGSDDWSTIKPFMYQALEKFKKHFKRKGMTEEQAIQAKFKEVYNYPERVRFQERMFT